MAAYASGDDLGTTKILRRYERWRRWENWVILSLTDLLTRTFSNQVGPIVALRRIGLWILNHVPPLKWLALSLMTGRLGKVPQLALQGRIRYPIPIHPSPPDPPGSREYRSGVHLTPDFGGGAIPGDTSWPGASVHVEFAPSPPTLTFRLLSVSRRSHAASWMAQASSNRARYTPWRSQLAPTAHPGSSR
jgi:hypothetical protein